MRQLAPFLSKYRATLVFIPTNNNFLNNDNGLNHLNLFHHSTASRRARSSQSSTALTSGCSGKGECCAARFAQSYGLRAYDAVHLAAALALVPLGVCFMTFDAALREAAREVLPVVWQPAEGRQA